MTTTAAKPRLGVTPAIPNAIRLIATPLPARKPTRPDPGHRVQECLECSVSASAGTDAAHWPEVARAHGEVFAEIRPAATAVIVAGLLDPAWFVEIEAEAVLP